MRINKLLIKLRYINDPRLQNFTFCLPATLAAHTADSSPFDRCDHSDYPNPDYTQPTGGIEGFISFTSRFGKCNFHETKKKKWTNIIVKPVNYMLSPGPCIRLLTECKPNATSPLWYRLNYG